MDTAARNVKVGITTDELDRIVHEVQYNIWLGINTCMWPCGVLNESGQLLVKH